jgi:transcriptional regulator with XRE-family HTH domain
MANAAPFARWLREQREAVRPRLTRRALAEEAGVSPNYISRLELNGTPQCTAPIKEPGAEAVDALVRVLEKYHGRPLVNEARRVLGYTELSGEPEPTERPALQLPEDDDRELAVWLFEQPEDRLQWMSRIIAAKLNPRVMSTFA